MRKLLTCAMALLGLMSVTLPASAQTAPEVKMSTYTYAIKGEDTLRVDVYLREDLQQAENLPVMLYVHGGGFSMGSRKNAAQEIFLRHYAEKGYLGASIDYRLGISSSSSDSMEVTSDNRYGVTNTYEVIRLATTDIAEATRYILDHFKVDASKVIVSGGSAGAITALQIENDICNAQPYLKDILPEGFNYAGVVSAAGAVMSQDDHAAEWPVAPCPMLLMCGDQDTIVPLDEVQMLGGTWSGTRDLHRRFTEKGYPHWTYIELGADHVVAMKHLTDNLEETDKFLRAFVDEKKTQSVYTEWTDIQPAGMSDVQQMIKYVPMYILGYDKYLHEMEPNNIQMPVEVKY